jgi:tetratricopeptide (TPR) repeat protein
MKREICGSIVYEEHTMRKAILIRVSRALFFFVLFASVAFAQPSPPPDANQVKDPEQAFKGGTAIYLVMVGFDLLKEGKNEKAVETFTKAIQIKPSYSDAHEGLARAYGNLNRWPEAISSFQEAVRLKPDSVQALVGLGYALGIMNRDQEALTAFKNAERINTKLATVHWGLASTHLKLGNRDAALREHKVMQTLDPAMAKRFEKYLYPPARR